MTALITKYRPRRFADVIGHASAVRALQRALEKGTSKTFLLTGPTGVGKTTLARIAATVAGCKSDIMEVDAATRTGIDDMREIAEGMNYAPLSGDAKAIIIDEAHALSKAAVQSLLKTFEEPPSWGYWFMCTTEPTKIPANLRSRCLHLTLKPVDIEDIKGLLDDINSKEKLKVKGDIVALCAEEAQGSPRQAITNLALCADVKNLTEAAELLQSAAELPQAIDLARFLFAGGSWRDCQAKLRAMKDQNAESVRQVVRAYMTTIALSIPGGNKLAQALAVLEAFDTPCNSQDGISPIVLRCASLLVKR